MKTTRLLLAIVSTIIVWGCSNQDVYDEVKNQELTSQNIKTIRSFDEALQLAQQSIEMVDASSKTRSGLPRKIAMNNSKVYKLDASTRSSLGINDTLMYVFNFEDNQGFVIISAPLNAEAILAVTEKGNLDPMEKTDIEGMDLFMTLTKDYLCSISQGRGMDLPVPNSKTETIQMVITKGPYVSVQWGQGYSPEGEYCPNGIAGCTNTAIAQIMSYYEYPSSINLTYPNADISVQTLNWPSMKAHTPGHSVSDCPNVSTHQSIGRLLRQLGKINHSDYSSQDGTSTSEINIENIGYYVGQWNLYDTLYITSQLNACHPLLMNGIGVYYGNPAGHEWVLDGYNQIKLVITYYIREDVHGEWVIQDVEEHIQSMLYHINWGWYGMCNGYFAANVFNTQGAHHYDGNNNTPDMNFTIYIGHRLIYPNQ